MSCVVDEVSVTVCPGDFAPTINSDVSGIGVRISFYLQALFLACLSARARSLDEITGALYTLIATNMAMAVTSLILGFKASPTLTFHDSLVVFYLLALSWASVFFSLPTYNRFVKSDKTLQMLSILQSYLLFAYAIAILIKAKSFGPSSCCNGTAKVVFFRPFSALNAGRIVGWIVVTGVVAIYTGLCVYDYWPLALRWYKAVKEGSVSRKDPDIEGPDPAEEGGDGEETGVSDEEIASSDHRNPSHRNALDNASVGRSMPRRSDHAAGTGRHQRAAPERKRPDEDDVKATKRPKKARRKQSIDSRVAHGYDMGLAGNLIVELIVILILWALMVMNTELMITWNNFQESTDWQFGQILPMFLVVLPMINTFKAYIELGFKRRRHSKKARKTKARDIHRTENAHGLPYSNSFPYNPFVSHYSNPLGGQPSAHISAHSIHSSSDREDTQSRSEGQGTNETGEDSMYEGERPVSGSAPAVSLTDEPSPNDHEHITTTEFAMDHTQKVEK